MSLALHLEAFPVLFLGMWQLEFLANALWAVQTAV